MTRSHVRLNGQQKYRLISLVESSDLPASFILDVAGISPKSYRRWRRQFQEQGMDGLQDKRLGQGKKCNDKIIQDAVFELLHSPPRLHDINRTTWKLADLRRVLSQKKQIHVSTDIVSQIIKNAGYKWRKAKNVLTSNDPQYREKLHKIKSILSRLGPRDRFFSIDEFGPFSVKAQGGRRLVRGNEFPIVPQYQKSKGRLIITAALELARNKVTHFYSTGKNTAEMIKLLDILLDEYKDCRRLYLSWDAASWHASKRFLKHAEEVNSSSYRKTNRTPRVELALLPARAQFLNVIESVFSGLARAVIHNSDYGSVDECKAAIDRYFEKRDQHFAKHPKRAGKKMWGEERTSSVFSESQNCKTPGWR